MLSLFLEMLSLFLEMLSLLWKCCHSQSTVDEAPHGNVTVDAAEAAEAEDEKVDDAAHGNVSASEHVNELSEQQQPAIDSDDGGDDTQMKVDDAAHGNVSASEHVNELSEQQQPAIDSDDGGDDTQMNVDDAPLPEQEQTAIHSDGGGEDKQMKVDDAPPPGNVSASEQPKPGSRSDDPICLESDNLPDVAPDSSAFECTIKAIHRMRPYYHHFASSFGWQFTDRNATTQFATVINFLAHKMYASWPVELQKKCVIIFGSEAWDHISQQRYRNKRLDRSAIRNMRNYPAGWHNSEFIIITASQSSHFSLWIIHNAFRSSKKSTFVLMDSVGSRNLKKDAPKVWNWLNIHRAPDQRSLNNDLVIQRYVQTPKQKPGSGLCSCYMLMNLAEFGENAEFRAALTDSSSSDRAWRYAYSEDEAVAECKKMAQRWIYWQDVVADSDNKEEKLGA